MNGGWGVSYEIALRWIPLDLTDDMSTLVQVMAWWRQATSHYLSQCWPRSMSPYGVIRPQWVLNDGTIYIDTCTGLELSQYRAFNRPNISARPSATTVLTFIVRMFSQKSLRLSGFLRRFRWLDDVIETSRQNFVKRGFTSHIKSSGVENVILLESWVVT